MDPNPTPTPSSENSNTPGEENTTENDIRLPDQIEAVIENLPEEEKQELKGHLRQYISKFFSGPLPPPDFLKEYEEVVPGCAATFLKRYELQSDHRMKSELIEQQHAMQVDMINLKQAGRGQNYALVIVLSFLLAATLLILQGHEVSGTFLGTIDLIGLVYIFVTGRKRAHQEAEANNRGRSDKET